MMCSELDRLFEWLNELGTLMNTPISMNLEDRIYGTINGGQEMPKGITFLYSVMTKFIWIALTQQNKEGIIFNDKTVWTNTIRRLKIAMDAFEIETFLKMEQIRRTIHPLLGYNYEQYIKARDGETERRNDKLEPLGNIKFENDQLRYTQNFTWKDAINIINDDNSSD